MTIAVSAVLASAGILLQDTSAVRWTQSELIGWLNDGIRELLTYKPNAYVKTAAVQLSAGVLQQIPLEAIDLFDITRNMGLDGQTPGNAIRLVSKELLDAQVPGWYSMLPSATVKHYTYSQLAPRQFYVYPPQPATGMGYVEMTYSAMPPAVGASDNLPVIDVYEPALIDYLLYRAYGKDAEFADNAQMSDAAYGRFTAKLTGKTASEAMTQPNAGLGPNNPAVPASQK